MYEIKTMVIFLNICYSALAGGEEVCERYNMSSSPSEESPDCAIWSIQVMDKLKENFVIHGYTLQCWEEIEEGDPL